VVARTLVAACFSAGGRGEAQGTVLT
jgi:hypothetical protein